MPFLSHVTLKIPRFFSTLKITNHSTENGLIAQVALNRPSARNAISRQLNDELHTFISSLVNKDPSTKDIRVVILTSTDPNVFCAGADLKERKSFTPQDTNDFLSKLNYTLDMMSEKVEIPTICAIQGKALGGGLELALATDIRILSSTASVGLPETQLAIIPGAGGTYRLPKLVGYSKAFELMITGAPISAVEALKIGLANKVADIADDEALAMAHQVCGAGPLAIKAVKQAAKLQSPLAEKHAYMKVVDSKDKYEALEAFAAKRKPKFIGQ